jgi:hypothetical protein
MISPKAEQGDRTLTKGGGWGAMQVVWLWSIGVDVSDVCLVTWASGRSESYGIQPFVIGKGFPARGMYLLQTFPTSFPLILFGRTVLLPSCLGLHAIFPDV